MAPSRPPSRSTPKTVGIGLFLVALAIGTVGYGCTSDDDGAPPVASDEAGVDAGGAAKDPVDASDDVTDAGRGIPAPGTATVDTTCMDAGSLSGAECKHLVVKCPGVADLGVSLRITRPVGAARATLLLGSGGAGNGFIEADPLALSLEKELVDNGYIVVSRSWDDPGWFAGSLGLLASSCRYGTLLRWVDENVRVAGKPYCAAGLSGGSYEIGYALARWDGADRLQGAILLAGPAVSQLDLVCPSVAPAKWTGTDCPALAAKYGEPCTGTLNCTLQGAATVIDSAWSPGAPCTDAGDPHVPSLGADGVVTPSSRFSYPSTKTRFVFGADECGGTANLYYDRIETDRGIAFAPATPHDVFTTDAGTAAARVAIQQACVPY